MQTQTTHHQNAPTVGAQINEVQVKIHGVVAHGYRASKLVHAQVFNESDDKIGTVHDLVISGRGDAAFAVLGVGGFLGIDEKLVAVPTDMFNVEGTDKVILAGATKEELESMPQFKWAD